MVVITFLVNGYGSIYFTEMSLWKPILQRKHIRRNYSRQEEKLRSFLNKIIYESLTNIEQIL